MRKVGEYVVHVVLLSMMNGSKIPFMTEFFVLPVISGILLALTLPWVGFSWGIWVGLVPLLLFVSEKDVNYKQAFQGGLVTGVTYFSVVAYPLLSLNAWWWLQVRGVVYENKTILLFWILYVAVLAASMLLGVFAALFKKLHREGLFSIAILAGAWVFLEYLRAQILFGFTWGHLGYAAYDSLPLLQFGYYGGVYTISFLVVLFNTLLYYAVRYGLVMARTIEGSSKFLLFLRFMLKRWHLYAAGLVLIAAFIGGRALLMMPVAFEHKLNVAVIQTGIHQTPDTDENAALSLLEKALSGNATLAVVPESAFPTTIFDEDTGTETRDPFPPSLSENKTGRVSAYERLISISKQYPAASIAVGVDSEKRNTFYNSLIVFENGNPVSIYHKRFLFPFSERSVGWFPWQTIQPLGAGGAQQLVKIQGEPVDALICSEVLFPELLEESSSRYIIAVGNDGVFDNAAVAEYNDAIARFTAVSAHKYLVRAMKTGVSSIIDPWGREIIRSEGNGEELLAGVIVY